MSGEGRGLRECAELRAAMSGMFALRWEEPLPTLPEIARRYGWPAAEAAMRRLAEAVPVEPWATDDVLRSMPPGATAYQLERRVKSPRSLARKIRDERLLAPGTAAERAAQVDDVLRYTLLTSDPDELVGRCRSMVAGLGERGWSVAEAFHSYTEDSRYRGLHAILRTGHGGVAEVQFHSAPSMAVKKATTRLYEINRDAGRPRQLRENAQVESIRLSNTLAVPRGLDELTTLGGRPVEARRFGRRLTPRAGQQHPAADPPDRHRDPTTREAGLDR